MIWRQTSAGEMAGPTKLPVPGDVATLDVGDLDGDGRIDLVISVGETRVIGSRKDLYVGYGKPDGSFQIRHHIPYPDSGWGRPLVADLDRNRRTNILLAREVGYVIYEARPDGSLPQVKSSTESLGYAGDRYTIPLTAIDLDNDNDIDLVTCNERQGLHIGYRQDDGSYKIVGHGICYTGDSGNGIAFFDINNDGYKDLLYGYTNSVEQEDGEPPYYFLTARLGKVSTYSKPVL
jgi:hypothetical protein